MCIRDRLSTVEYLAGRGTRGIESVHLFGASVPADSACRGIHGDDLQKVVRGGIINHYAPSDEVLRWAHANDYAHAPLGLGGAAGRPIKKYSQRRVVPESHRFASYAAVLESFP